MHMRKLSNKHNFWTFFLCFCIMNWSRVHRQSANQKVLRADEAENAHFENFSDAAIKKKVHPVDALLWKRIFLLLVVVDFLFLTVVSCQNASKCSGDGDFDGGYADFLTACVTYSEVNIRNVEANGEA